MNDPSLLSLADLESVATLLSRRGCSPNRAAY